MYTLVDGKQIVNATPHPITFETMNGWLVTVEPSGKKMPAKAEEHIVYTEDGVEYVTTVFEPTEQGNAEIEEIKAWSDNKIIIVGSLVSAQAYKGKVVAMVPVKGYERVAPAEKRMRVDKFTIFE